MGSGDGRTLLFRLYGTLFYLARSRHLSRGNHSLRNFALKPIPANLPRITILSLLCFLDKHRGSFPQIRAEFRNRLHLRSVTYFADIQGSPDSYYSFCHLINAQGNNRLICCCYYNHPSSSRFFAAAIASQRLSLVSFLSSPSSCFSLFFLFQSLLSFPPPFALRILLRRQAHSPAVRTPAIPQICTNLTGVHLIPSPPSRHEQALAPSRLACESATLSGSSLRDS
ncbi:hypothetical protein BJX66DRAFT_22437 [Aspergillus keveii]|uniref:Uncharacterized protein n=1 Tax=Aspergillus keveii TaxID=714993 RepID=A0ABR4GI56_9EURO